MKSQQRCCTRGHRSEQLHLHICIAEVALHTVAQVCSNGRFQDMDPKIDSEFRGCQCCRRQREILEAAHFRVLARVKKARHKIPWDCDPAKLVWKQRPQKLDCARCRMCAHEIIRSRFITEVPCARQRRALQLARGPFLVPRRPA